MSELVRMLCGHWWSQTRHGFSLGLCHLLCETGKLISLILSCCEMRILAFTPLGYYVFINVKILEQELARSAEYMLACKRGQT